jgi:hypothetical protein
MSGLLQQKSAQRYVMPNAIWVKHLAASPGEGSSSEKQKHVAKYVEAPSFV